MEVADLLVCGRLESYLLGMCAMGLSRPLARESLEMYLLVMWNRCHIQFEWACRACGPWTSQSLHLRSQSADPKQMNAASCYCQATTIAIMQLPSSAAPCWSFMSTEKLLCFLARCSKCHPQSWSLRSHLLLW